MKIRRVTSLLPAAAFLAVALAALPARADYYSSDEEARSAFDTRKLDVKIGGVIGGFSVGPYDGLFMGGGDLSVGYRLFDRVSIEGSAILAGLHDADYLNPNPVGGLLERYGGALKYTFARVGGGRDLPMMGSFYASGLLGYQTIRWDKGGIVRRNDAGFGFGSDLDFRISRKGNPKTLGLYFDFRILASRAPGDPGPAACQAICDEPTPPLSTDFAWHFRIGMSFGF
jgi:hypothetical protein